MMRQDELEHLFDDPVKNHERIMEMTRPPMPRIVHKEYTGRQPPLPDNGDELPLFSEEPIDTISQAMADLRVDMRTEFQSMIDDDVGPLTEAVAVLQGQVSVLMNLIGSLVSNSSNNNTVKEASETKTVRRVRQIESKPR